MKVLDDSVRIRDRKNRRDLESTTPADVSFGDAEVDVSTHCTSVRERGSRPCCARVEDDEFNRIVVAARSAGRADRVLRAYATQ